jgi:CheY-like chemotaxis protein
MSAGTQSAVPRPRSRKARERTLPYTPRPARHQAASLHLLVVDDIDDTRELYARYFRHYGYRVTEATDGYEALQRAREALPDVIVMDLVIPGIDGWETTRRLRRGYETSTIPIIALTAYAFPKEREEALTAGCKSFLSKPCSPIALEAEVWKVLLSEGGATPS